MLGDDVGDDVGATSEQAIIDSLAARRCPRSICCSLGVVHAVSRFIIIALRYRVRGLRAHM
jgi:hypothetical protein